MNLKCRKCGGNNFAVKPNAKNPKATDLYCTDCGAWQKFATKDEIRLLNTSKNIAPIKTASYTDFGEDVVVVTRCKGCIHYDMGVCLKIYSDGNASADAWQKRKPDDFCSYGEENKR